MRKVSEIVVSCQQGDSSGHGDVIHPNLVTICDHILGGVAIRGDHASLVVQVDSSQAQ